MVFAHKDVPYTKISGDFYGCDRLDRSNLRPAIADVSEHRPAAALVFAMFGVAVSDYAFAFSATTTSDLNHDFCGLIHIDHCITAVLCRHRHGYQADELQQLRVSHAVVCWTSGECEEVTREGVLLWRPSCDLVSRVEYHTAHWISVGAVH